MTRNKKRGTKNEKRDPSEFIESTENSARKLRKRKKIKISAKDINRHISHTCTRTPDSNSWFVCVFFVYFYLMLSVILVMLSLGYFGFPLIPIPFLGTKGYRQNFSKPTTMNIQNDVTILWRKRMKNHISYRMLHYAKRFGPKNRPKKKQNKKTE